MGGWAGGGSEQQQYGVWSAEPIDEAGGERDVGC